MIVISLMLAFIECAQMSICLFLLCHFYMVELKLSYRSSGKFTKKKVRNLTVYLALPFRQFSATKQGTKLDGPCLLGPKQIYRLLVPPGKTYKLLADHLITGLPLRSVSAYEKWFQVKPSIHISSIGLEGSLYFKHVP